MSENTNTSIHMVNEKLQNLWEQYTELFNHYNPVLEDVQRSKMDYLMGEIRSLEAKRETLESASYATGS